MTKYNNCALPYIVGMVVGKCFELLVFHWLGVGMKSIFLCRFLLELV